MPHLFICSDEPITGYRTGQYETYLHETEYAVEYHHFSTDEIPRSNPFNYENRRNSAAPLGAIISENFKKQLERQLEGAQRMSGANAISTNDSLRRTSSTPSRLHQRGTV